MNINFKEITLDNLGAWPFELKLALITVGCVLLLIAGYFFDFKSELVNLSQVQKKELSLRQEFEHKQQQAADLNLYKAQLVEMKKIFLIMLRQLPGRNEIPGLLEDISKIGIASGLEFKSFKPLPEQPLDFYTELPIQISVTGNYQQIASFISQIAALDRIVTVHDFTLQKPVADKDSSSGLAIMDMTAKTYRYSEQHGASGVIAK